MRLTASERHASRVPYESRVNAVHVRLAAVHPRLAAFDTKVVFFEQDIANNGKVRRLVPVNTSAASPKRWTGCSRPGRGGWTIRPAHDFFLPSFFVRPASSPASTEPGSLAE